MARLKNKSFIVSLNKNSGPDIPCPTPHRQVLIQLKIFLLVCTYTFKTVCFQFGKLILTNMFSSLYKISMYGFITLSKILWQIYFHSFQVIPTVQGKHVGWAKILFLNPKSSLSWPVTSRTPLFLENKRVGLENFLLDDKDISKLKLNVWNLVTCHTIVTMYIYWVLLGEKKNKIPTKWWTLPSYIPTHIYFYNKSNAEFRPCNNVVYYVRIFPIISSICPYTGEKKCAV